MSLPVATAVLVGTDKVYPVFAPVAVQNLPQNGQAVVVQDTNMAHSRSGYLMEGVDILSQLTALTIQVNQLQAENKQQQAENKQQQAQIDQLQAQNNQQQAQIDHLGRQIGIFRREVQPLCPSCQNRQDLRILYCGHLMCNRCVNDVGGNECPFGHNSSTHQFIRNPTTWSPCKRL